MIHVFDRGYAGSPWLQALDRYGARFIVRWSKYYPLENAAGTSKAAWKLLRGKRYTSKRMLRDARRKCECEVGLKILQVFHPGYGHGLCPLHLIVASSGQKQEPWYLLTNEAISTQDEAWDVVMAYARRWQIEACFRFNKTELALESPRLWTWERRRKLLMLVTLVYALLLATLQLPEQWRRELLRRWCHRTGKRSRDTPTPLYRIRTALAALLAHSPPELNFYKSSG
ncbi:hypothetical protein EON80_11960 [bacterium]|nr:MAG: hypothetical protein EON80_11960 [bacterium]